MATLDLIAIVKPGGSSAVNITPQNLVQKIKSSRPNVLSVDITTQPTIEHDQLHKSTTPKKTTIYPLTVS